MTKTIDAPFGLIGRKLGHSWSPQLHAKMGSVPYQLVELEPSEVEDFILHGDWQGINVTIPYKLDAARLADERSERVEKLGAANTLVRRPDGTIYADNTDVLGFAWMLNRFCGNFLGGAANNVLAGKKALVLGSGGARQAVVAALEDCGATPQIISRSGESNYENLLDLHADAALVVNTTPVGMYPNCPASPLPAQSLAALPELLGVLDIVYNPTRTGICLEAEKLGLPCESGLPMLVTQAKFASELFQGTEIDDALLEKILGEVLLSSQNVVLIGMPGAGKTSCGKRLARMMGRPFIDLDDAIAAECGKSAADIIREQGEDAFRAIETKVTGDYAAKSGLVIACGGGVVTREENYALLHQNSRIVMLDRPLDELSSEGRPMSQSQGVAKLAEARMPIYRRWADIIITCTGSATGDAELIHQKLTGC